MSSPDQRYFTDLAATVANALREDIGNGDLTARLVPVATAASARVISRMVDLVMILVHPLS